MQLFFSNSSVHVFDLMSPAVWGFGGGLWQESRRSAAQARPEVQGPGAGHRDVVEGLLQINILAFPLLNCVLLICFCLLSERYSIFIIPWPICSPFCCFFTLVDKICIQVALVLLGTFIHGMFMFQACVVPNWIFQLWAFSSFLGRTGQSNWCFLIFYSPHT